jgi:hypothetical protein
MVGSSSVALGLMVPVMAAWDWDWDWDWEEDGRGAWRGYLRRCGEMRLT